MLSNTGQPLDLDAIEARANAATPGPWEAKAHAHAASGCRCLSCDEDPAGWIVDHPAALFCDDIVGARSAEGTMNEFGRELTSCETGPLLSFEDASFAAHAREDVPALLDEVRRLADLVREACMLRDFHRRQADHLAAKRDLAETVLAKWQAGDLKPEQALWMLQDAHAVGDVKTFDQLLAAARPSV